MNIKNARIYNSQEKSFVNADIIIKDGKFAEIKFLENSNNLEDYRKNLNESEVIIPGFIDIHSHGAAGVDMFSGDSVQLAEMSRFYAQNGVTSLFLTTMSESHDKILRMIEEVKKARQSAQIDFMGIHLEGPYINRKKAGAHALNSIKDPDLNELEEICAAVLDCGLKLHVTLAPELDGGLEAVKFLKKRGATVSLGHTEADAEIISGAIEFGAGSFTHLFNAMTGIHHRDAGVAGNAVNSKAFAELICDGIHVCPEIVSLTARAKGLDKIIIVSDSMSAAGLPAGDYNLGQQRVTITGGKVLLSGTDTIAGSTANLCSELNNLMEFTGTRLEDALVTVTKNPAECVGIYAQKGEIAEGKDADFIILDNVNAKISKIIKIKEVYVKGSRIF